ncbi:putative inorganic carbon transporter subunit DabA, partial [Acidithiobacillus ferrooxidans]|uniref:putative inorganic carbon transporter subunit DabA n=1 Tax=Acidithiobacillus ferrooxidans TaxID=920 RepID=UPI0023B28E94
MHDYDWQKDVGFELIMTAPMVVANWINMQYYGSMVDTLRFGSGNKVLHNVVGGSIGVLEGNGGDLLRHRRRRSIASFPAMFSSENWWIMVGFISSKSIEKPCWLPSILTNIV